MHVHCYAFPVYLSALFVCLSRCLPTYMSVCLAVCLIIFSILLYLNLSMSVYLSTYIYVCFYLSIYRSLQLSFYVCLFTACVNRLLSIYLSYIDSSDAVCICICTYMPVTSCVQRDVRLKFSLDMGVRTGPVNTISCIAFQNPSLGCSQDYTFAIKEKKKKAFHCVDCLWEKIGDVHTTEKQKQQENRHITRQRWHTMIKDDKPLPSFARPLCCPWLGRGGALLSFCVAHRVGEQYVTRWW